MSGVVHFKFKSSNSYDSVGFDGAFVSVGELKALIAEKKGLSKDATSELLLSDPRTQSEYNDDAAVIPKSSSVLVRRVPNLPPAQLQQQQPPQQPALAAGSQAIVKISDTPAAEAQPAGDDDFGGDLYTEQRDEDAALTQLLSQAGQNWEKEVRSSTARGRGRGRGRDALGRGFGRGRGRESEPIILPKGYICYRCGQQGHHISDCPTNTDPDFKRIRPAVGVPSVLLTKDKEGGLLLPDGTTGSLQPNEDAFLKETMGMPGAKAAAKTNDPADGKESDSSKAIVVHSEAAPALAGGGDLALPTDGPGLLLPPGAAGMLPWDAPGLPPFLPGMPLPGMGLSGDQPLSREEFLRMKQELRRKQDSSPRRSASRSRSRSRSRHSDRRRRGRDSRSPRRRDSRSPRRGYKHRRRRSRDRSQSKERRPFGVPKRRSPSPGFIQLRKRSRSPAARRYRQGTPDFVQLRHRGSTSPPRRRTRHVDDVSRWNPEEADNDAAPLDRAVFPAPGDSRKEPHFGHSFDARPEDRRPVSKLSPKGRTAGKISAGNFQVPQLLGDSGPSYYDLPTEHGKGEEGQPSRSGTVQGIQRQVVGKPGVQNAAAAGPQATVARDRNEPALERAQSPTGPRQTSSLGTEVKEKGVAHGPLPKTFSIPVAEDLKEKKPKKSKKAKDKGRDRSKKPSKLQESSSPARNAVPEENASPAEERPVMQQDSRRHGGSEPGGVKLPESLGSSQAQDQEAQQETQRSVRRGAAERSAHGPLFLKAVTDASLRSKAPEPTTNEARSPMEASKRSRAQAEEPQQVLDSVEEDVRSGGNSQKKKKEHKHKSKKKHKEKRSKDDK